MSEPRAFDYLEGETPSQALMRVAQRDYTGVNEGYWIMRDIAETFDEMREALADLLETGFNVADTPSRQRARAALAKASPPQKQNEGDA